MDEARYVAGIIAGLSICVLGLVALRLIGLIGDGGLSLVQLLLLGPLYAMGHFLGRYIVDEVDRSERRKD